MKKILLIIAIIIASITPALSADIDFKNGYISDKGNLIGTYFVGVLNTVLDNLRKDTKSELAVVTLNEKGETSFDDLEKEVLQKYKLGGNQHERWVILFITRSPYEMDIRTSKDFEHVIPPSMKRSIGMEFGVQKMIINTFSTEENQGIITELRTQYLYGLISTIAEAIADEYNARVYYSEPISLFDMGLYTEVQYFPKTNIIIKIFRRYNLFPSFILLCFGIVITLNARKIHNLLRLLKKRKK